MSKKFYITTTLPYVNAEPHIGFALEIVQADVIARYHRLLGESVVFNFGTDEHGLKIYRRSQEQRKTPQEYCDEYAAKWQKLKEALNLTYTNFIRTTDPHHLKAAQGFWQRCLENGDIYKKNYRIKYCVGCELEKTESELVNGKCPLHPNREIEIIEEENYFFKFSKYQKSLLDLYDQNPQFVIPDWKFNEIKTFVKSGLQDFSISRLKKKMPWGVPIPNDPEQVMYVWFDALINYISTLGWPEDKRNFEKFWGTKEAPNALQVAGKDNLRQQSAMWQAMLMSAGLPNSRQILIHGFITAEGQKMSKSLGNVVNPFELVEKYGTDAVRYYLLREIPPFKDGDFSLSRFKELYNADLANGLGNLVARVLTLAEKHCGGRVPAIDKDPEKHPLMTTELETWKHLDKTLAEYKFNEALESVWKFISEADKYIDRKKPWELATKNKKEFSWVLYGLLDAIHQIAWQINPFLPQTSQKIAKRLGIKKLLVKNPLSKDSWTNIKPATKIQSGESLFPRVT